MSLPTVEWRPKNKKHLYYDELYQRLLPLLLERPCAEKREVIEKYLDELCPQWHWECDEIQRDRILWTRLWLAEANADALAARCNVRKLRRRSVATVVSLATALPVVPIEASTSKACDGLRKACDKLKALTKNGKLKLIK
jgi:hypothetical protein